MGIKYNADTKIALKIGLNVLKNNSSPEIKRL